MADPFFSIIIPTYNRKHIIGKTIESALNQEFDDFEVIVVDDGSTDNTAEFLKETFDDQIKVISIENGERGRARNTGAQSAKGQYVYFLDSDDILYPEHLRKAHEFIQSKHFPKWIFQEYELSQDGKNTKIKYNRRDPIKTLVTKGNFMSCHGVFLRMDIAVQHPFDENRIIAGSEDYALWLELAARYPLHVNEIVTSALIQHSDRSVFNFPADKLILRKKMMLEKVLNDEVIITEFSQWLSQLRSNAYSYVALHLALTGSNKKEALKWFFKSLKVRPHSIISKRTGGILRYLFL